MLVVNARFLTQNITGVQRHAIEISKYLKDSYPKVKFVSPNNIVHKEIADYLEAETYGFSTGHLWEQVELPVYLASRSTPLLVNLANTAPLIYAKQIITIHDLAFLRNPEWFSKKFCYYYKFLIPKIAKRSLKIITVSEFSKDEILKLLPVPENKIKVVYNGVSENFTTMPKEENDKNLNNFILAISSLEPRKNFKNLILAYQKLDIKDVKLVVAGSKNKIFADEGIIELINSNKNIIYKGYVTCKELVCLFNKAQCLIYPSFYEGFGLPPLEAMACGCPVIVSSAASLPEVCGEAAHYVDPNSIDDIARGMKTVLSDKELRKNMIKQGSERVERFNWRKTTEETVKILDEHLDQKDLQKHRFKQSNKHISNSRIKIFFDARMFYHSGIGRYGRNLYCELLKFPSSPMITLACDSNVKRQLEMEDKVINNHIPFNASIYSVHEQVLSSYLAWHYQDRFDIFHFPHYNIPWIYIPRMVVTCHDLIHLLFPQYFSAIKVLAAHQLLKKVAEHANMIITVSKQSKQDFLNFFPHAEEKVKVIYNGVEAAFKQLPKEEIEFFKKKKGLDDYLLYVGNLKPHKNLPRLIAAFTRIRKSYPGLMLIILSQDNNKRELIEAICKWKVQDSVKIFQHTDNVELVQYYNAAQLLVFPSIYEGFGLPPLEAMACGTPVVTSNSSSLPEITGEAAILVESSEIDSITEGINRGLCDSQLRGKMRQAGLNRARRFSWKESARQTYQVYQQAAD